VVLWETQGVEFTNILAIHNIAMKHVLIVKKLDAERLTQRLLSS